MSKVQPIHDTVSLKESDDDILHVDAVGKRDRVASLNKLHIAEVLMELSPLEVRKHNIERDDDLSRQIVTTNEVPRVAYRLYKRRWAGLVQLVLLNMLFGYILQMWISISEMAAKYFNVSMTEIKSLSFAYIGALCSFSPLVVWVLHRYGCRPAFITAGLALALGNLMQYKAVVSVKVEVLILANMLFGAGASFVLIIPTHYSDVWFSPAGRMGATAVASLAFPAGSGLCQFVGPHVGIKISTISSLVAIVSMVSTILSLGAFFVTSKPPTPASASRSFSKVPVLPAFVLLIQSKNFWLLSVPFAVYFGSATAMVCLLDQIFAPYKQSSIASVCGVVFIGSGLFTGIILPRITARYNISLIVLKTLCPIIGLCYLAFIWVPGGSNPLVSFSIAAILGGASFSLVPITLEYLVDITHPIAPESTSSLCWVAGLLLSAWTVVIMEIIAMHSPGDSPHSMKNSLTFQAAVGLAVIPLPFFLDSHGPRPIKVHIERC